MESTVSNRRIGSTHTGLTGRTEELDRFVFGLMTGDVCVVPNVFDLMGVFPDLRDRYLDIWNNLYGESKGADKVPDNVKVIQGMATDGDFWGYNLETNRYALYTGDFARVEELTGRKINPALTPKKNQEGIIHCVRLDIDYETEKNFTVKPTTLNKNTNVTAENFVFIPYAVVTSMIRVLRGLLKDNMALKVTQNYANGVQKSRFVSIKSKVVKHYSDKFLTKIPQAQSFPMNALVYIPTLGAPSTTLGLTRIDLLNLEKLDVVTSPEQVTVSQVDPDPVNSLVMSEILGTYVETLFAKELDGEGNEVVDPKKQSNRAALLGVFQKYGVQAQGENGEVSSLQLIKATHELSTEGLLNVWAVLPKPWHEYLIRAKKSISQIKKVENFTPGSLVGLLRENILMVTWLTKGTKFSRSIVTNSEAKLSELYGKDYPKRYESDAVRARIALEILGGSGDLDDVREITGINLKQEDIQVLEESLDRYESEKPGKTEKQLNYVTARALFQPTGSNHYYRQIPKNRIYSVSVLY